MRSIRPPRPSPTPARGGTRRLRAGRGQLPRLQRPRRPHPDRMPARFPSLAKREKVGAGWRPDEGRRRRLALAARHALPELMHQMADASRLSKAQTKSGSGIVQAPRNSEERFGTLASELQRLGFKIPDCKQEGISPPLAVPIRDHRNVVRKRKQVSGASRDDYLVVLDCNEVCSGSVSRFIEKAEFLSVPKVLASNFHWNPFLRRYRDTICIVTKRRHISPVKRFGIREYVSRPIAPAWAASSASRRRHCEGAKRRSNPDRGSDSPRQDRFSRRMRSIRPAAAR